LGDTLEVLREGKVATVAYETTFLINWPEHLGGGTDHLGLKGAMTIVPLMGAS
jgi:hypothetical protein